MALRTVVLSDQRESQRVLDSESLKILLVL